MSKKQDDSLVSEAQQPSPLPEDGLGIRVRQIREQKGLTHDGLSSLTKVDDPEGRGISRTTIRGYELGTYKPGAREIRILAAALEVSPTWLILGAPDGHSTESTPVASYDKEGRQGLRWGEIAFTALASMRLGDTERQLVADLIETMYRLKVGEESARRQKAFVLEFCDVLQDFITDRRDGESGPFGLNASPTEIMSLFKSVVADFREKHGKVEADLLVALFGPYIQSWMDIKP